MKFIDLDKVWEKVIALIVWNSENENEVCVYLGKLKVANGDHYFVNEDRGWKISLDEEQLSRFQSVSNDLKEILLNADYALSMTMGDLPVSGEESVRKTGIKWLEEFG